MIVGLLGWSGAAVLLVAYGLVSRRRVSSDGIAYQLMNVYGAGALAANSAANDAWPSVALNVVWVTIGVVALRAAARRSARRAATPAG